jgi:hypothetical protein
LADLLRGVLTHPSIRTVEEASVLLKPPWPQAGETHQARPYARLREKLLRVSSSPPARRPRRMLLRAFFYSPTREIRAGIAPVKAVVAQPEPFAFHHGACRGIPARLPPEQLAFMQVPERSCARGVGALRQHAVVLRATWPQATDSPPGGHSPV